MYSNMSGLGTEPENLWVITSSFFLPKSQDLESIVIAQERSIVLHTEMTALIFLLVSN